MKRDLAFDVAVVSVRDALRSAPVAAVALAVLAILAIYWRTAESIVSIWIRSETFAHGFIIVPLCIWLAWRKRNALAAVTVKPWWPGLGLVLASGALWFIASAADALGLRQFALAFMLQASIVTIIGIAAARVLAFSLAFLLFAVPVGEFMIPTLIDWTADFTVNALRFSGVPVHREANHFQIPSGAWSVVEACSGIRYIIASVMVGTIYAAVAYRSRLRRVLFIAASILVPVVANWLRAYMIVMLGHLSNNKIAVGVDHIIYGWIFFGVVMLLLFWVGSFWQQSDSALATPSAVPLKVVGNSIWRSPFLAAAVGAIAVASIWQPLDAMVAARNVFMTMPRLDPIQGANGWTATESPIANWKPRYAGYKAEFAQTYSSGSRDVGLYIAFYRGQEKGRELITSGNQLTSVNDWEWKLTASGDDTVDWEGRPLVVDRGELGGKQTRLEVFRLYWLAGHVTSSPYIAKALQAWWKILGRGDDAALIVIYTPIGGREESARDALRAFAGAMAPSIERALQSAQKTAP